MLFRSRATQGLVDRVAQTVHALLAQAGLAWCAMDGCSGPPDLEAAAAAIAALCALPGVERLNA